jgi:hypothetical protein
MVEAGLARLHPALAPSRARMPAPDRAQATAAAWRPYVGDAGRVALPRAPLQRVAPSPRAEPLLPPSALHFLLSLFSPVAQPQALRRRAPSLLHPSQIPCSSSSASTFTIPCARLARILARVRPIGRFLLRHRRNGRRAWPPWLEPSAPSLPPLSQATRPPSPRGARAPC